MAKLDLSKKNVLVIGMGISGRSAAQFLISNGARVKGVDRDQKHLQSHPEIGDLRQQGVSVCLEADCHDCQGFDFVVLSPGIAPTHPLVEKAHQAGIPVVGEIELGCLASQQRLMGITGTNGKTTVTLLVTHVLNTCGQHAKALGNVGVPFTKELLTLKSDVTVVLELSSYQIETLYQPVLEEGLILNITPDHLDRYGSMQAYAQAKCLLERCVKPDGVLYVEESAAEQYGTMLTKSNIRLYGYSEKAYVRTDSEALYRAGRKEFDLPHALRGKRSHDLENFMAAFALCAEEGISGHAFLKGWQTFRKPSHRIEFIREFQGVRYYDDSKGTNLDAVIRAVQFLEGPIILIAGGVDKGAPYTPWIQVFKNKVKLICAIGQAAAKINGELGPHFPVMLFKSLEEAVNGAAGEADKGDIVLLSPGCSSFDMFRDYAHRGEEFQRLVRKLI